MIRMGALKRLYNGATRAISDNTWAHSRIRVSALAICTPSRRWSPGGADRVLARAFSTGEHASAKAKA